MPFKSKEKEREYQKQYHLKTWQKRKAKHSLFQKKRKQDLAQWFHLYKINLFCKNCGENHPSCLDFHHLNSRTKEAAISDMVVRGYSQKTILKEVDKCIILCRNCHAKRHSREI